MRAWHFVNDTLRDGSPVPKDGVKLVHTGKVIPCQSGLMTGDESIRAAAWAAAWAAAREDFRVMVHQAFEDWL